MKQARSFLVIHWMTQSRNDLRGMTLLDALTSKSYHSRTQPRDNPVGWVYPPNRKARQDGISDLSRLYIQ